MPASVAQSANSILRIAFRRRGCSARDAMGGMEGAFAGVVEAMRGGASLFRYSCQWWHVASERSSYGITYERLPLHSPSPPAERIPEDDQRIWQHYCLKRGDGSCVLAGHAGDWGWEGVSDGGGICWWLVAHVHVAIS